MAVARRESLVIVGCGPGSPAYMTEAGRRAIDKATLLVGSPHLLQEFATAGHEKIPVGSPVEDVLDAIASRRGRERIAILVSGDPGLCSLAGPVMRRFGREACEVIPGVSSVQVAFARLGLDWLDARIISAHREIPDISPTDLSNSGTVVILAGHRDSRAWIADLAEALAGERSLVLCEDLSLDSERIRHVPAREFRGMEISSRSIVLLLKENIV